ncbi:MAG: hypothetical protein GY810_20560 [Aureispira sp.]|nr:hypothetical protein [Aureispira sp.]
MKGLFLSLLVLVILSNTSCRKAKHTATELDGTWERIYSSDGRYLGMEVSCSNGVGTITSTPDGSFNVGQGKWNSITPVVSALYRFTAQELGSDGEYYNSTINTIGDTLVINVSFSAAPGYEQKWIRK